MNVAVLDHLANGRISSNVEIKDPLTMPGTEPLLPIGEIARRTGLAVSAVRFYETEQLITAVRSEAGHRRFPRSTIRRLSFILITQQLGYSLSQISEYLIALPNERTPTETDWERLSIVFTSDVDDRIQRLHQLKDSLTSCIGCGCLSLQRCAIYNPNDRASGLGNGPRYLLGDTATDTHSQAERRC